MGGLSLHQGLLRPNHCRSRGCQCGFLYGPSIACGGRSPKLFGFICELGACQGTRVIVEGSLRYGTEKSPGTDSFSPKMSACILAPLANALPKARADLSQVLGTQGDKAMEGGDDAKSI